jgi:hypothetical protein
VRDGLWVQRLDAPAGHAAAFASLRPCVKIVPYAWNEVAPREHEAPERIAPLGVGDIHSLTRSIRSSKRSLT